MSNDAFQAEVHAADADRLVVVCAGTPWHGIPASEHQIADKLTEWASVLYVDPPTSIATRRGGFARMGGPRLRIIHRRLAHLTPIAPPGSRRRGMVHLTEQLTRWQIRSAIERLRLRSVARILASDLPLFERDSRERKILFATDDFAAGAGLMGLDLGQILRHQQRLARESDLVVAVSTPIAEKWRAMGCTVALVPNGCDADRFAATDMAAWPQDVRLPKPIAGFVGQINDRLAPELLDAIAARGRSVLLVGPMTQTFDARKLDGLLRRPNVQWVGPKPFDLVPSYLRAIHVGLTPYSDTVFNRASFPLKTIEYLAAGRAAVSMDLPTARWLDSPHLSLATNPIDFADAVDRRLGEPLTSSNISARREFASLHSWSARARQFAELLGLTE